MASEARESLTQMGFPSELVERALKKTGATDLTVLVDWIEKHQDDDNDDEDDVVVVEDSEKQPLTEEQKAERLAEMIRKRDEKRKAQAKVDAEENRRNEQIRRKQGQDTQKLKQELERKEHEKAALQRKKEKEDDKRAMAEVRAKIKAQQREREEKAARAKGIETDHKPASAGIPAAAPKASTFSTSVTRLQIRIPGGRPITQEFSQDDTLSKVFDLLQDKVPSPYSLSVSFPRKVLGPEDSAKSLKELDLVPSAALIVS